jgi:GcrA cell cycle regulator
MQSTNWTPEHSSALREHLAKGMSYFGGRGGDQREIQHRLFPQRHDRPRQAIGVCQRGPPRGLVQAAAETPNQVRKNCGNATLPAPDGSCPSSNARSPSSSVASKPIRAICRCWSLSPTIAATPMGERRRRAKPSPSAVSHALRTPAIEPRISSDAWPRPVVETDSRHRRTRAGGGGMKREPQPMPGTAIMNPSMAVMIFRMRRLPRRHRIAHLCALIGQTPRGSIRRAQLVGLFATK